MIDQGLLARTVLAVALRPPRMCRLTAVSPSFSDAPTMSRFAPNVLQVQGAVGMTAKCQFCENFTNLDHKMSRLQNSSTH